MSAPKRIIIYSHGFGVRKDDRGLFTDIAASLPNIEHILFDYNEVDEAANTLTVAALDVQAQKLLDVIAKTCAQHPHATIDLIAHSQGCVVAALAQPQGIRKTIFTAPPNKVVDTERKIQEYCKKYDITFTKEDTIRLPRRDGSTTIIPPDYWRVRDGLDVQEMYSQLAKQTDLTIITATEDEVLGEVIFDHLDSDIKIIPMATGHNFEGAGRSKLTEIIRNIVSVHRERIVIVNDQDEVIGHKERGTLVKEDIYRVSGLWVTNSSGDILLAQRKFTKKHDPGKWGPAVAGTVDAGETYESNIIKEAAEEIGLKDIQPTLGPKRRVSDEYNYFCQWYTLVVDKPAEAFTIQEDEVERVKWFMRSELEKGLEEHPEDYLKGLNWAVETLCP
jgi:isopentenyldiphosphate isomerase